MLLKKKFANSVSKFKRYRELAGEIEEKISYLASQHLNKTRAHNSKKEQKESQSTN